MSQPYGEEDYAPWKQELSQRPGEKGYFNNNNAPAASAGPLHTTRKRARSNSHSSAASNSNKAAAKYHNHAKTIQHHLDKVKHVRVAGNPQNTSPMWEEYDHYEKIEKIAEDKQKLILAEIQAHDAAFNGFRGGSRRKTRRNRA